MKTTSWTIWTIVKKVLTALVFVGMLGGVAAGPARAEDGWGHHHEHNREHRHDREHRWHEREWREEHRRSVYGYAPPVYGYYAPPVVVYAPPPPPSVSFVFPIR